MRYHKFIFVVSVLAITSFLVSKCFIMQNAYGSETPGSVDTTFSNFTSTTDSDVNTIAIQSDGKYLLGGYFTTYDGVTSQGIVKINTDGSIDDSFTSPLTSQQYPFTIVIQSNGKILVGGNDGSNSFIMRLNSDGSQDSGFTTSKLGLYNNVNFIALLSDGSIIVPYIPKYGDFNSELSDYISNPSSLNIMLIKLNSDGSLNTEFNANFDSQMSDDISFHSATVLSNDSVLLVGSSYSAEHYKGGIVKINANGTPADDFYYEGTGIGEGGSVDDVEVNSNGKIWISGTFTEYNGVANTNVAKLNSDGTLDSSFVSFISVLSEDDSYEITRLAIQPDGKVIGTGFIYGESDEDYRMIARFNADGSKDITFDDGSGNTDSDYFMDIQLLPDNQLLAGGYFATYDGEEYVNLIRINLGEYVDTTSPIGTISINNGALSTSTLSVSLLLSATDSQSEVSQMMVCSNSDFLGCNWESYATTKSFTLASGDGTKTIYVKYKDSQGNISSIYNDSIIFAIPVVQTTTTTKRTAETTTATTPESPTATETSVTRTLVVKVLDQTGAPVVGAHVVLESGADGYTDASGEATFNDVAAGTQKVKVKYQNYEVESTASVLGTETEDVNIPTNLTVTLNTESPAATNDTPNAVDTTKPLSITSIVLLVLGGLGLLVIVTVLMSKNLKKDTN